jgi:polar amino acid transport system substrate-binding protein
VTGRSRLALLAPAAVLVLAASGCAQKIDNQTAGGSLQMVNAGQLTTCTHLPYKPFQFTQGGKTVGFDVDLVDLVAKDLKVEQQIFDTPFEGIESGEALNAKSCDLAAAGMTITPERQQAMDFSDPYFNATQALLVRRDSAAKGLADLRGKTLAVQLGTTGEEYAEKNKARYGFQVKQYEDLALLETAVKTGQVDAGVNDNGVLYDYVKSNPDTRVATEFKTGERYGIAVQKGNKALLEKVNAVLAKAEKDGEYAKIYQKWFGKPPQGQAAGVK